MFVILNEKSYQKAKNQIETLNQRKTFGASGLGSIHGISAWITLYNTFFRCIDGKFFFAYCLVVSVSCAIYLFLKFRDTVKIAYNFSMFGFIVLLYPKYPDMIFLGAGISIFIFLFFLTVPAFTVVAIQTKAIRYIKHYENPAKYSTKHKIYVIDKP
nr:hypothetical protein [uncultured Acetatifactor sp.]